MDDHARLVSILKLLWKNDQNWLRGIDFDLDETPIEKDERLGSQRPPVSQGPLRERGMLEEN